jgi:ribosome modulation factor
MRGAKKAARMAETISRMRAKYADTGNMPTDKQEALRRGYNDAVIGLSRKNPPFASPELRKAWRKGFDIGKNGLKVKLPPQAFFPSAKGGA